MPQLSAKNRDAFSPKVVVRGLRSLTGCSSLRAYWLFLGINIYSTLNNGDNGNVLTVG